MSQKIPLTVIFTTFNEAHNIAAALDSVYGWAQEVIVVDSFSTDDTEQIVKTYHDINFIQRQYFGPAFQKNWAIPLANNEWVLLMDADERTTSEMRHEIDEILRGASNFRFQISDSNFEKSETQNLKSEMEYDCFWIGFTHYFMDKKIRYSGWQNDKTIRLIKRDKCRYNDNRVHEEIITEGLQVGQLRNKFEHYTFKDINHFVTKQQRYAAWSAEDYETKTGKVTYYHLLFKPFFRFFKHFIVKKGILDGHVGFIISAVAAWTVFKRYVYVLENRRLKPSKNDKSD